MQTWWKDGTGRKWYVNPVSELHAFSEFLRRECVRPVLNDAMDVLYGAYN